ncbi:glycosyltransferase family 39 protein [Candidatus Parcubacteria bacterium]|nr:glycosyltransferase family 39 protein [Candidatus Parcubacteria bacterium]
MYIGIGKYMFSHGAIGLWEPFRPPLLPIILGSAWKIGIDPLIFGKIIMVISSLVLIWLVYIIGEKLGKNIGLYSAALLSLTPVFIVFSNTPLSDIPSTLFITLAFLVTLRKKYIVSGILMGLAFLTRFPQIIALLPLVLSIWILQEESWKIKVRDIFFVLIGLALVTLPFFITNYFLYTNPLYPIIEGNRVAAESVYPAHEYFYYGTGLLTQNPLLIFVLVTLGLLIYQGKRLPSWRMIRSLFLFVIIPGAYFTINPHQELRYAMMFLPFLVLLAGYGIAYITEKISWKFTSFVAVLLIIAILGSIGLYGLKTHGSRYKVSPEQYEYLTYFKDKGRQEILTSSPQSIVFSDISIVQAVSTWEFADQVYNDVRSHVSYIAINTCELVCEDPATCPHARESLLQKMKKEVQIFFKTTFGCELYILKP